MTPSFALEQRRVEDGEAQESPKDDNVGFALIRNSSPILNEYKEPFFNHAAICQWYLSIHLQSSGQIICL